MKYIAPSFTEIEDTDFFSKVALIAHNCYQVEKNEQPQLFVERLLGFKHFAMIEHYNFVAELNWDFYHQLILLNNHFITLKRTDSHCYVSFSLRPLLEEFYAKKNTPISSLISLLDDNIQSLFTGYQKVENTFGHLLTEKEIDNLDPSVYDDFKFVSLKIITDRGVTHELVRHRVASYAQESTRYCNYSKNKFGNELTFIAPVDYQQNKKYYDETFAFIEKQYMEMTLDQKIAPELARSILPNKLKASIIITCSISEYKKIFALRCDSHAHPDMREIMIPIQEYFTKKGYLSHGE